VWRARRFPRGSLTSPSRKRRNRAPADAAARPAGPSTIARVTAPIDVSVLVFASLRERVGAPRVALRLPAATPVGAVWDHLPEPVRSLPPPAGLRYALNGSWTLPGAALRDGDEVALILPVSGG